MADTLLISAILGLAIILVIDSGKVPMYEFFSGAAFHKAVGAILGAGIAAWCIRSVRWVFDIFCGVACAVLFGSVVPEYMGWMDSKDTWLATGGLCGLLGSRVVNLVLNRNVWAAIGQKVIKGAAK